MNPNTDLIAARIEALPMSGAERAEAMAFVAAGENFAGALLALAQFFHFPQVLKPSH